jgi:hypothetical protein
MKNGHEKNDLEQADIVPSIWYCGLGTVLIHQCKLSYFDQMMLNSWAGAIIVPCNRLPRPTSQTISTYLF